MTKKLPDTLYHYTDANSLMSILRTQTLWATDAIYLNDSREIRYGIKKFKQVLTEYRPVAEKGGKDSAAVRLALGEISRIESSLHDGKARRVYVTCFSAKSDSLSQWRGYGNSGGGFAIGFDRKLLADLRYKVESVKDPLSVLRFQVDADDRQPSAQAANPFGVDEFLEKSFVGWGKTEDVTDVSYGNSNAQDLCNRLVRRIVHYQAGSIDISAVWPQIFTAMSALEQLCLVKSNAFKDEREWRVVVAEVSRKPILEFRPSSTLGVVPYIVLRLPSKAIKSIVVGPGRHGKLRAESVKQLLAQLGMSDVEVINSEVPFRS